MVERVELPSVFCAWLIFVKILTKVQVWNLELRFYPSRSGVVIEMYP